MDVRNAVVPRQALVDEREVRIEQIDDAAILLDDGAEQNVSVSRSNDCRRLPSHAGESGRTFFNSRSSSHCPAKFATSASARAIRQHPLHLPRQHGRRVQHAALRVRHQLIVGNAAPQKEREPRRQLDVAEPERRAGARR